MPVSYNSSKNELVIKNERYITFEKVWEKIDQDSVIQKTDHKQYLIYTNVRLENSWLEDENASITVMGEFFRIDPTSTFKLGKLSKNEKHAYSGCYFSMPNPKLAYGFGNDRLENDCSLSGDLFLYDSKVDVWCFWAFFRGPDQIVDIRECNVNGFGRIQGQTSVIQDVYFKESNGRYGILSPKGGIREYSNVKTLKSTDAAVYFNPDLSDNMKIYGGVFGGYQKLVYAEPSPGSIKHITFVDSDIRGDVDMNYAKNTELRVGYTFNPTFMTYDGNILVDHVVTVTDSMSGEIVYNGYTDMYGQIHTELICVCKMFNKSAMHNADFIVQVKHGDLDETFRYRAKGPYKKLPLYVGNHMPVDNIPDDELNEPINTTPIVGNIIKDDAIDVMYICSSNSGTNKHQKDKVITLVPPGHLDEVLVYTDIARDAYDKRPSYDEFIRRAFEGEIKKVYILEPEVFGPTRKDLTCYALLKIGVEIIKYVP